MSKKAVRVAKARQPHSFRIADDGPGSTPMEARDLKCQGALILLNSTQSEKLGARGGVLLMQKTKFIFPAHN
jgi:hypothetical protein